VIIVQENRSFDNIFAGFPRSDSQMYGYLSTGKKVPLHSITFDGNDLPHGFEASIADWDNGKMDGFNKGENVWGSGAPAPPTATYAFLARTLVQPYWEMAQKYVLADHMFPTMFGGSFTAHLDLVASTANLNPSLSEVDFPTQLPDGCDATNTPADHTTTWTLNTERQIKNNGPFPCFTQFETIANSLDGAHISWKYYAPPLSIPDGSGQGGGQIWSIFDAIKDVRYGSDWSNNIESASPETTVLTDIAAGKLPSVAWVIPDIQNSDHPESQSDTGPSWVGAVVNAVGKSKYWSSSAIIVLWDDWGGWYDNLPPPQKDFRGLGIRVPCIIISPYVNPHVSHTVYEFGSILKFVEQAFGLKTLAVSSKVGSGYTDERATSSLGDFDFTQKARAFVPITTKYPPSDFLKERHSYRPPDND
jgi:phospholipase C